MLRCYNCEALDCPREEFPARFLPTPPPSYIDNLQRRLIRALKGIFPASLKMILKTEYQLSVQRPAPGTSVQPDHMIGEHRAGENSQSSECDPSVFSRQPFSSDSMGLDSGITSREGWCTTDAVNRKEMSVL